MADNAERSSGRGRTVALLAVGIVLVLGGAVFALTQVGGGGAGSPEDAAEQLFDAVEDEDLLGLLESLLPSERDAFGGSVEDLAGELRRLGVLSDDLNLRDVSGLDLSFDGLRFSVERLTDALASVQVTGGTATFSVTPEDLPLGGFLRDMFGDDLGEPTTETSEAADDGSAMATVKEGGRWYVSLWYSVAEAYRMEARAPLPGPGDRVVPRGAATPEKAVEELFRATLTLDLRRVIELLPPDEARALHDYAYLFLDEAEESVDDLGDFLEVNVRRVTATADRDGREALVTITDVALEVTIDALGLRGTIEDGCVELRAIGEPRGERICTAEDFADAFGDISGFEVPAAPMLDVDRPNVGFVAVERGGAWFVSPTRSLIGAFTASLRVLEPDDLDDLGDLFGGLIGS